MALFSALFLITFYLWQASCKQCKDSRSEYGSALVGHVFKTFTADRRATCYSDCNIQPVCQSLNYNLADHTCEFNIVTKHIRPDNFVKKESSVYADNPDRADPWTKLNTESPQCFGVKGDQFGSFVVPADGSSLAVKLVYLSGSVTCNINENPPKWSYWGCDQGLLRVFITTSKNAIILPESQKSRYRIPGYDSNSSEPIFTGFSSPLSVSSGQELRLWHSKDFFDKGEDTKDGTSCADMYAVFI